MSTQENLWRLLEDLANIKRAKMHGLRLLRDSLAEKISEEFPDLESAVQDILERD